MKKIIASLLVLCLSFGFSCLAQEIYSADGYEYIILEDGTAEIYEYVGEPGNGKIKIPSKLDGYKVTSIDKYAFFSTDGIREVIIPEGVKRLGDSALSMCDDLVKVSIPGSVVEIEKEAVCFNASLERVEIEKGVEIIGDMAFAWCDVLEYVELPSSVISIGERAFEECEKLTLSVKKGSYAEQYAIENGINYICK